MEGVAKDVLSIRSRPQEKEKRKKEQTYSGAISKSRGRSKSLPGGKIMEMGVYFSCFMRKKTIFSQVLQLPVYKSIFFI
jgi:hypothetical protein